MQLRRDILFLGALTAILSGCDLDEIASFGNAHAYEKDFHQHYPLKSGGTLSLDSFNGAVEISGWDQEKVQVDGVQYASTERLRDAISIDVVADGNSVQIRTIRPIDARGNMGVKYIIKAPRKVNLDRIVTSNGAVKIDDVDGVMRVRTSNGSVRASRVRGDVDAQTSNGSVEIRDVEGPATIRTTNGPVRANGVHVALQVSTSNGPIHAMLHDPRPRQPVKLSTTNGGIELTMNQLEDNDIRVTTSNGGITLKLPSRIGARVRARTSHSSIHSDFDVDRDEPSSKHRLEGRIGGGGPTLELTTSNGSIRLLKL